ncbi:MAG: tRNA (adenosine(37)-N6)-threonylcarbamoyltransferase complex ATPase subunit type 1 TsaE [Bacteroidota bacterium]
MHAWQVTDVKELAVVAADILTTLDPAETAYILALHGDLGAGKTTFTQQLAAQLGVTEVVTSPTFVVMKQYPLTTQMFDTLVHIDAYRIEEVDEMRVLGFGDLVNTPRTLVCIEWAERIKELLPPQTIHLHFSITETGRLINRTDHG